MTQQLVPTDHPGQLSSRQFTPAQVEVLKRTIAKGVTDDELLFFLAVCDRTGLDPFARQIYAIVRKEHGVPRMVIQTGIDGFRAIASRSPGYGGQDEPEYGPEDRDGFPEWARVTVYKIVQAVRCPFVGVVRWKEFAQDTTLPIGALWKKMPHLMLGKCGEAQALRKAFPYETSQVQFTPDDAIVDATTGEILAGQFQVAAASMVGRTSTSERALGATAEPSVQHLHLLLLTCPDHGVPWKHTEFGRQHPTEERRPEGHPKAGNTIWCGFKTVLSRMMREAREAAGLSEAEALAWCKDSFGKVPSQLSDEQRIQAFEYWSGLVVGNASEADDEELETGFA